MTHLRAIFSLALILIATITLPLWIIPLRIYLRRWEAQTREIVRAYRLGRIDGRRWCKYTQGNIK